MDRHKMHEEDDEDKLVISPVGPDKAPEKKGIEITVKKNNGSQAARHRNTELEKYICLKCRYKFTRKVGSNIALRCPYCGTGNVEKDTFDINQAIRDSG